MEPEFNLWAFLRYVLSQGAAIETDYRAGKWPSYEGYSARMDAAARDRAEEFTKALEKELRVVLGEELRKALGLPPKQ